MRETTFKHSALLAYFEFQVSNKRLARKINDLLKDIARHPTSGLGKPEALKGDYAGYYSRRIDEKNRIIYRFDDERVEIVQVGQHYNDK